MNAHTSTPLVYEGHIIPDRDEMISLTSLWKAEGADESRTPYAWLRSADAKRFIEFLADSLGSSAEPQNSRFGLVKVAKGGNAKGDTFAHWQIAMAYGKYLSPKLHAWCNTVVRDVMQGKIPSGIPDDIIELLRRDDGMLKQVIHKVTVMQKDNVDLSARLMALEHKISSATTCTAHDIWIHYGLPPHRGGTLWLGFRLAEMGCVPEFGGRELVGGQWRRKFDTARAHLAMKNGLKLLTDRYIAERHGQGRLKLVQRE